MVTQTIQADTIQVVVDIGVSERTAPWFTETTYLIDSLGHTTAIIAQTGSELPTGPIPLTPLAAAAVPITSTTSPAPASAAASTTATAAFTASPTLSTPQSGNPASKSTSALTIGMVTSGIILVILAIMTGFYLWRRDMKRQEVSSQSYGSSRSSSASSYSLGLSRPWDLRSSADATWSEFIVEFQNEFDHFDEGKMSSIGDYTSRIRESRSSQGGYRETVGERQERPWRLATRSHSPPPPTIFIDDKGGSSVSFKVENEMIDTSLPRLPQSSLRFPLSILKRPPTPTSQFDLFPTTLQTTSSESLDPTYRPNFVKKSPLATKAKKVVRFGVDQIKEFGRTPVGSRAGSIRSPSIH